MYLSPYELRSFVVLAGELHFRKASERLSLSQPALSKQIRKLEEKVGGPLFTRTRRRVILTEAGRVFLPQAENLLNELQATLALARNAVEGRAGSLRVGFGIASVFEILPRTIQQFRHAYPLVHLQMLDMSTPSQIKALLDGQLDIGMVRLPVANAKLDSCPLFRERLVLAAPREMSFGLKDRLASLRDHPFVLQPRSESTTCHDHVLAVCRRSGFTPQVFQEATELFTILSLVRAGLGVSLVPRAAIRIRVPGVRFHELHMAEAEWRIGMAWNRISPKLELLSQFCTTVRKVVNDLRTSGAIQQGPELHHVRLRVP